MNVPLYEVNSPYFLRKKSKKTQIYEFSKYLKQNHIFRTQNFRKKEKAIYHIDCLFFKFFVILFLFISPPSLSTSPSLSFSPPPLSLSLFFHPLPTFGDFLFFGFSLGFLLENTVCSLHIGVHSSWPSESRFSSPFQLLEIFFGFSLRKHGMLTSYKGTFLLDLDFSKTELEPRPKLSFLRHSNLKI